MQKSSLVSYLLHGYFLSFQFSSSSVFDSKLLCLLFFFPREVTTHTHCTVTMNGCWKFKIQILSWNGSLTESKARNKRLTQDIRVEIAFTCNDRVIFISSASETDIELQSLITNWTLCPRLSLAFVWNKILTIYFFSFYSSFPFGHHVSRSLPGLCYWTTEWKFGRSTRSSHHQQHFISIPVDVEVVESTPLVELECKVGNLMGQVQWSKDGFLLGMLCFC